MRRTEVRFEVYSADEWRRIDRLRKREAWRQTLRTWRRYYAPAAILKRFLRRFSDPLPVNDHGPADEGPDDLQGTFVPRNNPLRPASGYALELPFEPEPVDAIAKPSSKV